MTTTLNPHATDDLVLAALVEPLESMTEWGVGDVPETFPWGV
jgi:hypothetical protein